MEEREPARREVDTGGREGIEESRDEARGDPPLPTAHPALERNDGEGTTRGEPQQGHRDGEDEVFERFALESGENGVHEPEELEYEPAHGNAEVGSELHRLQEGENHGTRERDDTTHPAPPITTNTPANPRPYERARIDWATDTNTAIGPIPTPSDFRPTKPRSPLASPNLAPRPPDNLVTPAQPVCTPSKPTVTPSNGDVAPRARTPATDAPTMPRTRTPVSPTRSPAPITVPSRVPAGHAPSAIVHGPRDLSALRSDAPNPWGTLRRRHYHRYSHTRRQFGSAKRGLAHLYPTNAPSHNHSVSKSAPSSPISIFETVRHPLGIGPTKPVIRTPARMTMDTPTYTAPSHRAIVKSAPPLPPSHPAATVQCQCGQLVPIPSIQQSLSIPLHHTLSSFISHFFLLPFSFPGQFFSRFAFA